MLRSRWPRPELQLGDFAGDRIEDAAVFALALRAFGGVGAIAEQALEDHARIDLHGQRQGRGAPGYGIHVGATVAYVADADQAGVFGA